MFRKIQVLVNDDAFFAGKLAVELSHLIGFKSVAMEFPLVIFEKNIPPDTLCFTMEESLEDGFKIETEGNFVNIKISPNENSVRRAYEYVREHFYTLAGDFQRGTHEWKKEETPAEVRMDRGSPPEIPAGARMDKVQMDQVQMDQASPPAGFTAAKTVKIAPFDNRGCKGLESLFDKDFILFDDNNDLLPDRLDAKILLRSDYNKEQIAAACNLAARLGLETTAAAYPLTSSDENAANLFLFIDDPVCALKLEEENGRRRFMFSGRGGALVNFSSALCENFPRQKPGKSWLDLLNEISAAFCMQTVDGQLAYLELLKDRIGPDTNCYFSPKVKEVSEEITKAYAPAVFQGYKDLKKVYETEYDIPWEVDQCRALLSEKLWPRVKKGDKVEIRAVLSEDREIRDGLKGEIKAAAAAREAVLERAEVICAYKQGFCWLEEQVMPKLLGPAKPDKIEIAFKPFLAPVFSDWQDEDGAVPTYNNIKTDNENKWFDLPIRYLQELYPIDDILAAGLGIDRDKIIFSEYKGGEDITYHVKATKNETLICEEKYKASVSERSYMDIYPGMGKVHPSTGWLWAAVNGKELISERIPTDVELVWQIYQENILPYVHGYCQKKTGGKPSTALQPFFAQMRLDILLSEPNEKLPCREDLISSLDTLHEDLYFTGLDFFKVYGNTTAGEIFDAPGLILPVIKKRAGKPYFKFTLYDQNGLEASIDFGGESVKAFFKKEDIHVTMPAIFWNRGKLNPVIRAEGPAGLRPLTACYAKLLSEGKLSLESRLSGADELQFEVPGNGEAIRFSVPVHEIKEAPKDLSIDEIDILESSLIGYDEYMGIIEKLKRVPGLSVYPAAESYLGRDVYAIEFLTDYPGYVSRTRLVNQNPSLMIIARHHANEVSSTNAAFMLVKKLLKSGETGQLSRELNLAIAPFTNADGAAIHYELQKDNPTWIFHIARFNAIGREFYYEYFKDGTIHTEALCATRLWRKWLPDIIVDNHGVPTHEWAQQFSGYTSPSYKGFWLPRSLLYGCYWTVKEECWKSNLPVAKKMEEIIADVMAADGEIRGWNLEWQERFAKYANKWMPRLFPANYYRDMVNVWVAFDFDINHRYPSVRYPWITTVAYTSEVTDETAHGACLNLVARVHMMHDIAVIKMMREGKCVFNSSVSETGEGSAETYSRQRPLIPR